MLSRVSASAGPNGPCYDGLPVLSGTALSTRAVPTVDSGGTNGPLQLQLSELTAEGNKSPLIIVTVTPHHGSLSSSWPLIIVALLQGPGRTIEGESQS